MYSRIQQIKLFTHKKINILFRVKSNRYTLLLRNLLRYLDYSFDYIKHAYIGYVIFFFIKKKIHFSFKHNFHPQYNIYNELF